MRRFFSRTHPRKRGYDYALPGAYLVTVVTHQRVPILGRFADAHIVLSPLGKIVARLWTEVPRHFPAAGVDTFVIMPDHVHALVVLSDEAYPGQVSLSEVVRWVKGCSAREWRSPESSRGPASIWQATFHDRIIRSNRGIVCARRYIETNPFRALERHGWYRNGVYGGDRDRADGIPGRGDVVENPGSIAPEGARRG